jgi:DNA-nicking Smr family endonuclease
MSARGKIPAGDGDALWREVTKTIKPLRKERLKPRVDSSGEKKAKAEKPVLRPMKPKAPPLPAAAPVMHAPPMPSLVTLDRRSRSRVARGNIEIEGRLDLHGYKLLQAKDRLILFLEQAQAREKSLVLVITGKGTVAPHGAERGVLKREVPLWLSMPEFRALVIGFEEAAPLHGGAGALYVRVRRRK